jgi:hypothetical protein
MALIDKLSKSNREDNFRNKEVPKKYNDKILHLNKENKSTSSVFPDGKPSVEAIQHAAKNQSTK